MEEWSIGGMEYWTAERDRGRRSSEFQHSNTPTLQSSNPPILQSRLQVSVAIGREISLPIGRCAHTIRGQERITLAGI